MCNIQCDSFKIVKVVINRMRWENTDRQTDRRGTNNTNDKEQG